MDNDSRKEKNTLHALIDIEQGIQKQVEEEERRAARWLGQKQTEIQRETEEALQRLEQQNRQALAKAAQQAEEHARTLIRQASAEADRLKRLDPQKVRELVFNHLSAIDPRTPK